MFQWVIASTVELTKFTSSPSLIPNLLTATLLEPIIWEMVWTFVMGLLRYAEIVVNIQTNGTHSSVPSACISDSSSVIVVGISSHSNARWIRKEVVSGYSRCCKTVHLVIWSMWNFSPIHVLFSEFFALIELLLFACAKWDQCTIIYVKITLWSKICLGLSSLQHIRGYWCCQCCWFYL